MGDPLGRLGQRAPRTGRNPLRQRGQRQHHRLLGPRAAAQGRAVTYLPLPTAHLRRHAPDQRLAHVIRTRQGWGATPGQDNPPPASQRHFIVDFQGPSLEDLDADQPVEMRLTTSKGEILEPRVQRLPDGDTWRANFRLAPEDGTPADMRLALMLHGEPLTETWNYVWYPNERR
nr:glucan biosynthesis protein [Halomonas elongata]